MKRILLLLFITLSPLYLFAQGKKIDSLSKEVMTCSKSNYRNLFKNIEAELLEMEPSEALEKLKNIETIASKLSFYEANSAINRCKAIVHDHNKSSANAILFIKSALEFSQLHHLKQETAENLKTLGTFYHHSGQYKLALNNYYESLGIFEQRKDSKKEVYLIYSYLGDIYYRTQHYKLAKEYLLKAYQYGKKYLDAGTLIHALNTIASIYRNNKEYEEAINSHREALSLAKFYKDSVWQGTTNGNIGRIFQLQEKYDYALMYYERGLLLSEKFKDWNDVIISLSRIGEIYLQKKQYSAASKYLTKAIEIANRQHEYDAKLLLYQVLANYYRHINQLHKAFDYQKLYMEVKDSIARKTFIEEIDQIRSSFEIEKKQSEIELLSKKNEIITASEKKKNLMLLVSIVLLSLVVIVTLMLYRSNREKMKTNHLLEEQKVELHEKNEEINVLNNSLERMVQERTHQLQDAMENLVKQNHNLEQFSYVISHNLRSPIAHILGLVSIFNKTNIKDPSNLTVLEHLIKAAKSLDEIVSDLNNILLIRNHSVESMEEINLSEVAELTIESLRDSVDASQALIYTDFSEAPFIFTNKSYLNSILYNLLSNALKFRAEDRTAEILIKSSKDEKYSCLTIQDNGIGMLLSKTNMEKLFMLYQKLNTHQEGKGMGLFIVKEQIESLDGKIEVESEPDQGTKFKVYFPLNKKALSKKIEENKEIERRAS